MIQEWQPIETAPKDGTVIILNCRFRVVAGYWNLAAGMYGPDTEHPWTWLAPYATSYGGLDGHSEPAVTHWMPLPDPPVVGEAMLEPILP
jgi:hypothetical protein